MVFVELPEIGRAVAKGDQAAVVESVKAASEIYAPVGGEVVEGNAALVEDPALVNRGRRGRRLVLQAAARATPAEADGPDGPRRLRRLPRDASPDHAEPDPASSSRRRDAFVDRHIGPREAELAAMLAAVGCGSLDELIDARRAGQRSAPTGRWPCRPPDRGRGAGRPARHGAAATAIATSLIGMGYYGTHTPPVILRNVLENPGWYTAYTPYQAEVSQGRLEAVLNYQQMVVDLTGMELANASLLDEATAAAEAMAMAHRVRRSKSDRFFVDADCHPQTLAVLRTRAAPSRHRAGRRRPAGPTLDGPGPVRRAAPVPRHRRARSATRGPPSTPCTPQGGLAVVATDLLALTLLTPPGELGADIVLGSAQRFGVPMGYGGPHAAFFATKDAHKRAMPGRIIGVSVDSRGQPALRMALQTREQHIRRDKATCNICTAQVLLAVIAGFYAVWHGPEGLTRIAAPRPRPHRAPGRRPARDRHRRSSTTAFFDTLTLRVPGRAHELLIAARDAGINLRLVDADRLGVVARRDHRPHDDLRRLLARPRRRGRAHPGRCSTAPTTTPSSPPACARTSPFLTHPVFHRYRSETEMLRYLRRLQAKDIALDRAMIPLGSCTMKLNATAEMIPVTWPEFADAAPVRAAGPGAPATRPCSTTSRPG